MRRLLLLLAATAAIVAPGSNAWAANVKPAGISDHSIGETMAAFLRAEPEAQSEADACRQQPDKTGCAGLLAVLDDGQSGEISIPGRSAAIFKGGRLVRLTMLVDGAADAAALELTKEFGPQSRKTVIPGQNIQGARWENYLYAWDTPDASATLYEDNDPLLSEGRLVLVVESRSQGQEETVSVTQLRASRNRPTQRATTSRPQPASFAITK